MLTHGHVVAALLEEMKDEGLLALRVARRSSSADGAFDRGSGGSSPLGKDGQICSMKSRKEVEGQGMGCHLRW